MQQLDQALLDMDGVIADFLGGAARAHDRPWPYDDPKALGVWETADLWGITVAEFWAPLRGADYWADLEPTADGFDILEAVEDAFGDRVCLLTTPSKDPECPAGKLRWIAKHVPQYENRYLMGPSKEFCTGPNRLLIDDRDENVERFVAAGGTAFLLPRPWNKRHAEPALPALREFLNQYKPRPYEYRGQCHACCDACNP